MAPEAVNEEVRGLDGLDLFALRSIWAARFGAPPTLRSAEMLRRILAWRIQATAFGGPTAETHRELRRSRASSMEVLRPGTKLVREWKGVRHEVEVLETGLRYGSETFESLSQVARAITGVRWNGPRFFGLRKTPA